MLQFHIHWNGMPLVCPDQRFILIEGIPLLGISPYNFFQHLHVKWSALRYPGNQIFRTRPSVFIQFHTNGFRVVPQNKRYEFSGIVLMSHILTCPSTVMPTLLTVPPYILSYSRYHSPLFFPLSESHGSWSAY